MSQVQNSNDFINRLILILTNSKYLFPNSIGNNSSTTDLVNQIIAYDLPIPQSPSGPGLPHIYIYQSTNGIISQEQKGRSTIDIQGPKERILEFWVIAVAQGTDLADTQTKLYNIIQAISQTLDNNLRCADLTLSNALAVSAEYFDIDFALPTDSKTIRAKNLVYRPKIGYSQR